MRRRRVPPSSRLPEDGAEAERVCRRRAMDLLARRDHSRLELDRKLTGRGFEPDLVEHVLDELTRDRLLEEDRFVESFIRGRIAKGQGPVRIRGELAQHGIEDARVSEALAEADCDWTALAAQVCEKRFGSTAPGDFRERARQAKFLQYRGFETAQIRAALDETRESD